MEKEFAPAQRRIQESLLAPYEKRLLVFIAGKIPTIINSDHLTLLGFISAILCGVFYYFSKFNHNSLWMVNALIFLNWFGDSLDGTLARVRNKQRPRYGYYIDHILDALSTSAILWGIAYSGLINQSLALLTLTIYLIISINSYLSANVFGSFQISYLKISPTELRILMIVGNILVYFKPMVRIFSYNFYLFDVGYSIGLIILFIMLIIHMIRNAVRLYCEESVKR